MARTLPAGTDNGTATLPGADTPAPPAVSNYARPAA